MQILEDNIEDFGDISKRIQTLREKVQELLENRETVEVVSSESNYELAEENALLKKQLAERDKTIKELDFKLGMFKLAKTLREGSGIGSKSEELKQMITEYIKEIDKSIASLNIE